MSDTCDLTVDYIGFPEELSNKDDKKYIKAYCKCEIPMTQGICIPRKPNKIEYSFYCPLCGTIGKVLSEEFLDHILKKEGIDEPGNL